MPSDEIERAAQCAVAEALSKLPIVAAEYMNTAQAARYVSMSEEYLEIARHRADGSGPEYIKLPRAVRYRRADLDRWMESHRKGGSEPVKRRARAVA
jgi:predicted DNA-binding transcriptional regulator AlpA